MSRPSVDQLPQVVLGAELLTDQAYRESGFYTDFGKELGVFHLVGSVTPMGDAGFLPLGMHRPPEAQPFGEPERQIIQAVLPHLCRAIRLQNRLDAIITTSNVLGAAALDALSLPALIVDADMRVIYANVAAEALGSIGNSLLLYRDGPAPAPVLLGARVRADAKAMGLLVRAVAERRSPGGGLRLMATENDHGQAVAALALVVTGLPARLLRRFSEF